LRAADRSLFREAPARPPEGALMASGVKSWVDALETQVKARNAAGARLFREYDRCRGGAAKAKG
jgi:hypothetical protein